MLKIFRIKPCENNKSCGISLHEPNKIDLAFFLNFLQFSRNFLVLWTELQENLDRVLYNQALNLTRNTLERLKS
jgi:hypothetical protein